MNIPLGAGLLVAAMLSLVAQEPRQEGRSQERMEPGITVEGTGEALAAADTLEYRALLLTGGATPSDAMTEYDRATARLRRRSSSSA